MTELAARGHDLSESEARALVDGIRADVAGLAQRLMQAYTGRAWRALGYDTWARMCEQEFGGVPRLPVGERREVVKEMRAVGMSGRAIGIGLSVDEATVRADLATAGNPALAKVIGLNGSRYTPPPPKPWTPPVADPLADIRAFWRTTRDALGRPAPPAADLAAVATTAELEMARYALRDLQEVLTQALMKESPNGQA